MRNTDIIVSKIEQLLHRLVRYPDLREDFAQELLLHIWQKQRGCPGHTLSWYIQSCRFYTLHLLENGRSIDAIKRRHRRLPLLEFSEAADHGPQLLSSVDEVLATVNARDVLRQLAHRLNALELRILLLLIRGYQVCEIAKRLHLSHPAVIRKRKLIAAEAMRIGFCPELRCRSRAVNSSNNFKKN